VARNRNGELQYSPKAEVGTRPGKELGKLLLSLAAVHGKRKPDEEEFRIVRRVAEDCLPPNRLLVIKALQDSEATPMTLPEVEVACGLARSTIGRTIDDLDVLGLLEWTHLTDRECWATRLRK
jgi:hypothetical protein